jgi:hypothetical protein
MTTIGEAAATAKTPLASSLAAGVNNISYNQTITFTLYQKKILPADGFVFWINGNLITPTPIDSATVNIQGSLHYSTEVGQHEDATVSYNTIVFTSLSEVDIFQDIDPQTIYLADFEGIRFSFSSRGKFYEQAGLYHYMGTAVSSVMETQIIDTQADLDALEPIVSNSLPIWLAMPSYVPPYPGFTCPIPLYPSFLVPDNEPPPYGAVHIEDTRSLVDAASFGPTLTSEQLAAETVRITTYGVNNDTIITFLNFVLQYSYDWNFIGMMNMPIIVDEKRTQPELRVIAQKKVIEFKVSYLQTSVRNVARQFIKGFVVQNEAKIEPPYISGNVIAPRTRTTVGAGT